LSEDIFRPEHAATLPALLEQMLLGALSFNGQRCTALKLFFVPTAYVTTFLQLFGEMIEQLPFGLPLHIQDSLYITPLPAQRVQHMTTLLKDAAAQGGAIVNPHGGQVHGELMRPALVFPVKPGMRLYTEEQFGPIIPVASYDSMDEVLRYLKHGEYGQQISIFSHNASSVQELVDAASTVVGRINVNTQSGRSPDSLPFSGRRSSAMGTMSLSEALRAFSIETMLAGKESVGNNGQVLKNLAQQVRFLQPVQTVGSIAMEAEL
jgi:glyceraldehyde-3-phosphate dehydrogenase (NADP+)